MKRALLFPGQGSQSIGMGKDLHDHYLEAKEVFQEVDDVLSRSLSKLIFSGDIEELTKTSNAQPAIMATSIAVLRVLQKQSGKSASDLCVFTAGHSLGEYSAHVASETFSLSTAAKLLDIRGKSMQEAAEKNESTMVALIGAKIDDAQKMISDLQKVGICGIANDNGAEQVVISGETKVMEEALKIYSNYGIKRAIKLNVSGAFHSALMLPAQEKMKEALDSADIKTPKCNLVSNVDVAVVRSDAEVRDTLTRQVTGSVRWRETMDFLNQHGIQEYVEVGPGKVLSTIAKRMQADAKSSSLCTLNDIEIFLS